MPPANKDSAMIKLIELAKDSKVEHLNELGERAEREVYAALEMNIPDEHVAGDRLCSNIFDHLRQCDDFPGSIPVGWILIAEATQPNGNTRITTRQWGSFRMPWNRIGALQYVTSGEMREVLDSE